jgi:hypothetical protein
VESSVIPDHEIQSLGVASRFLFAQTHFHAAISSFVKLDPGDCSHAEIDKRDETHPNHPQI